MNFAIGLASGLPNMSAPSTHRQLGRWPHRLSLRRCRCYIGVFARAKTCLIQSYPPALSCCLQAGEASAWAVKTKG